MTGTGRIVVFAQMFVPVSEFPIQGLKVTRITQWFIRLSKQSTEELSESREHLYFENISGYVQLSTTGSSEALSFSQ